MNSIQRKQVFEVPIDLLKMAHSLRKNTYKIGFLVECAYFRVTKKFFQPKDYHKRDVEYAANKLGVESKEIRFEEYQRSRIHQLRGVILNAYGFQHFDKEAENTMTLEITEMVRAQFKPKLIFWQSVHALSEKRISLPGSHRLSEIILTCLNLRKRELATLIESNLTDETRALLDHLFTQEHDPDFPNGSRYKLTLLKRLSQSTRPSKIKERARDLFYLKELYGHLEPILPILNLGREGIRFYAKGVVKADIHHLTQRSEEDRYVHVIVFIVHQYYSLQDNLTDVLLTVI